LKVITEAVLRDELRASEPDMYYIPDGKILSPAAREYLQQRKIKFTKDAPQEKKAAEVSPMPEVKQAAAGEIQAKYVDHENGGFYTEKPEHMTHIYGNVLVPKNHPRILFRGKLDSLQALIVLAQTNMFESGESRKLLDDLGNILNIIREIMRCDVLNEQFVNETMIGLSHAQLRERSHNPMKFFNIKQMVPADYTMGKSYALLNQIRTAVRETELAAAGAFTSGSGCSRKDIIQELNRMSSALHIMMCMYLAGEYRP